MQFFERPLGKYPPDALQFSPDGRWLAVQTHGDIEILDTNSGEWQVAAQGNHKVGTAGIGFTSDSQRVVFFGHTRSRPGVVSVLVHHLATGRCQPLLEGEPMSGSSRGNLEICATRLDGHITYVALNPTPGTVEIVAMDPTTGEELHRFGRLRTFIREMAVSADGMWVVSCSVHDLRVWDLRGGKRPRRAARHVHNNRHPCFGNLALSREGTYLACGSYCGQGKTEMWHVPTGEALSFDRHLRGGGVAFAADRDLFACAQKQEDSSLVVFFDPASRKEVRTYDWQMGQIEAITFSPDGCRCATGSKERIVIWDVDV